MGESFSRSVQACWDPEGTANIVRRKKQQRAVLNDYTAKLDALEKCSSEGERREILAQIQTLDRECQKRWEGAFWPEFQNHADWPRLKERRDQLGVK
mmetsp:Transcript_8780/g.25325  ORF Transcript_8780/g.25325 Transcript_8780/m.25325 type:complete len:97 (+) Transcript_8780:119-409(+)